MKKYKLTKESIEVYGVKLYRIEALMTFGNIIKGEKGGYIENESNLDQNGKAWVYGEARVYVSVISIIIPNFYPVTVFCENIKDNYLSVGCQIHRESWWMENWETMAKGQGLIIKNGKDIIKGILKLKELVK